MDNVEINKSVCLVRSNSSTKNRSFGTAFRIFHDQCGYSYFLTCAHVIKKFGDSCSVIIGEHTGEVDICCLNNIVDLAVVKIKDMESNIPIFNVETNGKEGDLFKVYGFGNDFGKITYRPINGKIGSPITLFEVEKKEYVPAWDLIVNDNYGFQEGYSGSPVVNIKTNNVCGIVAIRTDEKGYKGIAISINALYQIWTDIPEKLLLPTVVSPSVLKNINSGSNELYESGYEAYQNKNYEQAFKLFNISAKNGNADSQNALGVMYLYGEGTAPNFSLAFSLCSEAANKGEPKGQNTLGMMYRDGKGIEKDYEKAVLWFSKSASQNYAPAQLNMADMYRDILRNDPNAVFWYHRLVQNENAPNSLKAIGQFRLGIMNEHGKGLPINDAKAFEWFLKSAENKNSDGQNKVGEMYRDGRGTSRNYKEAINWFQRAVEQENTQGQYNLGIMYLEGTGIPKNDFEAFQLFSKAAANHHSDAAYNLGLMYEYGKGNIKDEKQAYNWYTIAADKNNSNAQNRLGLMHERERDGGACNYSIAIKWFKKAAANNNHDGEYNLGRMYCEGKSATRNINESVYWFNKAAENGHNEAQCYLGHLFFVGSKEFGRDYVKAIKLFNTAALNGHVIAQFYLAYMLENGLGTKRNPHEANNWYKTVIQKKDALPFMMLGYLYEKGRGIDQDLAMALTARF